MSEAGGGDAPARRRRRTVRLGDVLADAATGDPGLVPLQPQAIDGLVREALGPFVAARVAGVEVDEARGTVIVRLTDARLLAPARAHSGLLARRLAARVATAAAWRVEFRLVDDR